MQKYNFKNDELPSNGILKSLEENQLIVISIHKLNYKKNPILVYLKKQSIGSTNYHSNLMSPSFSLEILI
ncbi:MAG: hypothetical protein IPJ43_13255 [Saprospiraceae bacterium]|nr:hypothetical protein [Saprospiraceae bacterium]